MSEEKNPEIDLRENGPLMAKHVPELLDRDGSVLEPRPLAALCRCGASANKPYCDGSHNEIGYQSGGKADAEKDRVKVYRGGGINVHFNALLCSHAGECIRNCGEAFDPKARPWVRPDDAALDRVRNAVEACPSGALRWSNPADESSQAAHLTGEKAVKITVERNGPLRVENVPLAQDAGEFWAEGATPAKYVLCRCGKSGNQPFCDGTHYEQKWRDRD